MLLVDRGQLLEMWDAEHLSTLSEAQAEDERSSGQGFRVRLQVFEGFREGFRVRPSFKFIVAIRRELW